jgi:2-polyprenyl-3-methyl-5-hydroxy-6-metoxy-1,4-benzoquinol methylase
MLSPSLVSVWYRASGPVEHIDRRFNQTQDRYAAEDLETIEEAKRYSAHVFDLFRPFIGKRVLEVGCGIGTMSRKLADIVDEIVGIEPNANCIERIQVAMRGEPKFSLRPCHIEECDPAELASHRFDTVYCVNVLEHIHDDVAALRTFRETILPDGKVLIFVPAVQAAYGPLDAELGHHRRYSKATLTKAFNDAGLDLVMIRYTNPIGLVGWMYNAHISKVRTHKVGQVRLFEQLVAPWALPLELSLMAVGRQSVRL